MRISKSILFAALFTLSLGTLSAETNPETTSARSEIKTFIQKADLASAIKEDLTVNVTFMVNGKNEIIILSTDKTELDSRIKSTLNYKKLKSSDMKINTSYTLPVVLKKV